MTDALSGKLCWAGRTILALWWDAAVAACNASGMLAPETVVCVTMVFAVPKFPLQPVTSISGLPDHVPSV